MYTQARSDHLSYGQLYTQARSDHLSYGQLYNVRTPKPGQTRILDGLAYFDSYYFCFQAKHLQIFSNVVYSDKKIRILIQDSKTCKQNLHLSF